MSDEIEIEFYRGRRLRASAQLRALSEETFLCARDLIAPIFVIDGTKKRQPVESLPGVDRVSVDLLGVEVEQLRRGGISTVLVFGVPDTKDAKGMIAAKKTGVVQRAIKELKRVDPALTVISDVCLCAYTEHGHCGVLKAKEVDNDATLDVLAAVALSHAEAGADVVAPSDMMDGRILWIRRALDDKGLIHTPILSYAAKYASSFYGPFKEAAHSTPQFGDRKSYQMHPANSRQAMREIAADIAEGADMVMVKPAMVYLDVLSHAKMRFDVPVFAFSVSGEYAMVKAAAARGWLDERNAMLELLTSIKRAGADKIITYWAKEFTVKS